MKIKPTDQIRNISESYNYSLNLDLFPCCEYKVQDSEVGVPLLITTDASPSLFNL